MFLFLYKGISSSSADPPPPPQRAELMGRVVVIPYRNDRQDQIKRECWWTWWCRWMAWWCRELEGGTGDGLRWCGWLNMVSNCEWRAGLRGPNWPQSLSHQRDNYSQVIIHPPEAQPSLSSSQLHHPPRVSCLARHSSTFHRCASSSRLFPQLHHQRVKPPEQQ